MKLIMRDRYRYLLLLGLIANIITAFFSIGYHHPDEHFQVLELAGYKLGNSPLSDVPWEFASRCRGGLLPFITYCIAKLLSFLHLYDPFVTTCILRLSMGVSVWCITVLLTREFLGEFSTQSGRFLYLACSFMLWFIPYLSVRFSAENVALLSFFFAFLLLYRCLTKNVKNHTSQLIIAGFLLGISFFVRLQMGLALAGLGIWLLFVQKMRWQTWGLLVLGGLFASAASIIIDRWLYDVWTFTPYNYFEVNVLQDKASGFGVTPWWQYFVYFIVSAVPPISLVLLGSFFAGVHKKPIHPFTLIVLVFLAGHMYIGHKELRFLIPVLPAFIFLACIGIDRLIQRYEANRSFRIPGGIAIGINFILLLFRSLAPAYDAVNYYSFIYSYARTHETTVVWLQRSPYNTIDVESNFYKPLHLKSYKIDQPEELASVARNENNRSVLYVARGLSMPHVVGLQFKQMFCIFPSWLTKLNFNNWQERANVWVIYAVQPKDSFTKK